mmetsp:Transcript_32500/g.65218  ORF Transcript_32500/g.65218 Transcript_32500/m.65218 type:complete len:207 (+) Transcript_32500:370-990(+)
MSRRPSFSKNFSIMPIRSPSARLRSTTRPSIWWNSARCVASRVSFRNTRSMLKYFFGLNSFSCARRYSICAEMAVVCVRRRFFFASASLHVLRYPSDLMGVAAGSWGPPVWQSPTSCVAFTLSRYPDGIVRQFAGSLIKKVSCMSRAGCACGWNSASKFQNDVSTNLFVGISSKPISRKISLNWARTLSSGCSRPAPASCPSAAKL